MGLSKILRKLADLLDEADAEKNCDDIKHLLKKLEKKRAKLEAEIDESNSAAKKKKLKLDLKITNQELKKGTRLLRKLCH